MKKPLLIEIGIWTVVLIVVFCGAIFSYSKFFVEPNIYTIEFKDIDGITEGSPVRFMGINIGYVRKLESKDKHIDVQILVTKKDIKLPNGTVARVEFYGLGGSKSIELMPPDGSCGVGILTEKTIRINDVLKEAAGFVEVLEEVEKFAKGFDDIQTKKFFDKVADIKANNLKTIGQEMDAAKKEITYKTNKINGVQKEINSQIQEANETVEKINKFIKK